MWKQEASGRVRTPLEPVVLAATLALIPVFILEADANGTWQSVAFAANWLIWGIFAVELAAVLVVAERKWAALRAHWLDVAVVVLTIPLFGRLLSSLRFVRFARLLRLLRIGVIISRAIQTQRLASAQTFRIVGLMTVFIVAVTGAAQATVNSEEFPSMWDGIWWAVVTVTTVGYGDLYPTSVSGRIIGIVLMLVGIGFLSVLTATIASRFIKSERSSETDEILTALARIEAEMADMKARLPADMADVKARLSSA